MVHNLSLCFTVHLVHLVIGVLVGLLFAFFDILGTLLNAVVISFVGGLIDLMMGGIVVIRINGRLNNLL